MLFGIIQSSFNRGGIIDPPEEEDELELSAGLLDAPYSGPENNLTLELIDIAVTGTHQVGQTLTITATYINNSGHSLGTSTCEVYRASNRYSATPVLVATVTSPSLVFNYVPLADDASDYLMFKVVGKLAGATNTDSEPMYSEFTNIIAA